jgi:DNA polymerase (family 10)
MAKASRERGLQYFGVADHLKSAHYAGGLTVDQISQQHRQADRLNKSFGKNFRVLKGIESDILADGSLDYPDDVLESIDYVVASVHSRFKLDRNAQTECLLRAVSKPYTTILGHMTGGAFRLAAQELDVARRGANAQRGQAIVERRLDRRGVRYLLRCLNSYCPPWSTSG